MERVIMQGNETEEENIAGRSRRKGSGSGSPEESGKAWKTQPKTGKQILRKRIIIFSILEVIVLAGIFTFAYFSRMMHKIQRPDFAVQNVENKDLSDASLKRMQGYWNIAAFGVDSRNSSVGRGNNSDVIMVISINQSTGEVRIVSVFRDSYMGLGNGQYNKINQAYAIGGPELAVKALNQDLDLNITDFITFNWKAVVTGINILGGVDVNLSKAEFYYINSYITETVKVTEIGSHQLEHDGPNHLDGVQAVAYARLRYMDNDYARTERQRKIIQLAYEKAKKADPATLSSLAGNMLSMVATNLTWQDVMNAASNVSTYHIGETGGFPFARGESNMGKKGACVIPQTLETNVTDLHKFLFDDEDYQCSEAVKLISKRIADDTGMYKKGTNVDHVNTDGGYIPKATRTTPAAQTAAKETTQHKSTAASTTAAASSTAAKSTSTSAKAATSVTGKAGGPGVSATTAKAASGASNAQGKSSAATAAPGGAAKSTTAAKSGSQSGTSPGSNSGSIPTAEAVPR